MGYIDLRSDTVTKPTPAMISAMAKADLGDDVYSEDPTVNRLQEMAAERMGKEAGLFVPSGTMGNLVAVLAHCNRGDEVIMGDKAHTFLYEAGGVSVLGSVMVRTVVNQPDGTIRLEDIEAAIRPDDVHHPISRLIILENTQNRCGGVVLSAEYTRQVAEIAQKNSLLLHLDGARIFNAAVTLGLSAGELAEPADSVTFCLSKALCAPVGSVLCGSKMFIKKAHRIRKMLGGGMRQAGVLAAAGIVSLQTMTERLAEDHARARMLAQGLSGIKGVILETPVPTTNMVFLTFNNSIPLTGIQIVERLKELGTLVGLVGERKIRLVTHYWISDEDVTRVINSFAVALRG